jgi:hypothetical protein
LFQDEHKLIPTFKIKDQEFGFIPDLEEMSYGEFVDLDTNISDWENMHKAMAVLFRPIERKRGDKYTIIPYHGTHEFSDFMKFMPLDVALGAVVFFLSFRERLIESYASLFGGGAVENELSEEGQFQGSWGWYHSLYALAQGDVRRFDEVTALPVKQCLTLLMYESQKSKAESARIKRLSKRR